ncbi:MAG: cysteine-S-conjugate beta-lyase, partial [Thermodesulfobacteriota bacterium]|nr:cysteine-S-conjugate beta-lyase [Thermodesulfobacteriota bacterium]
IIQRAGTHAVKYDMRPKIFGTEEVIPLWVADMDFRTPDFIAEAIRRRAAHELYGYTFVPESFYESLQSWLKERHGWDVPREWMLYCPGVVPALVVALLSFTAPGEGVLVQPPVYYPFFSVITNNGRMAVENPLEFHSGRLCMNDDHLALCLDERVKLMFLCSPHNPGGTVWRREELARLGELCLQNKTIIISDEIHADLVFSGHEHCPTASLAEALAQNTVTLVSPNKTFNIAGLSASVAIIPNGELFVRFKKTLENLHWTIPNIFAITAFEAAYRGGEKWLEQLLAYLEGNLNHVMDFMAQEIPGIKPIRPEGTYLIWLDCRDLGMTPETLKAFMIGQARVGLNEGSMFGTGGAGFQRLNIACPRSVLHEALARIAAGINKMRI